MQMTRLTRVRPWSPTKFGSYHSYAISQSPQRQRWKWARIVTNSWTTSGIPCGEATSKVSNMTQSLCDKFLFSFSPVASHLPLVIIHRCFPHHYHLILHIPIPCTPYTSKILFVVGRFVECPDFIIRHCCSWLDPVLPTAYVYAA